MKAEIKEKQAIEFYKEATGVFKKFLEENFQKDYLTGKKIRTTPIFKNRNDASDFLNEIENYEGEKFFIGDREYQVDDDISGFIREYGEDQFAQLDFEGKLANGLISEV